MCREPQLGRFAEAEQRALDSLRLDSKSIDPKYLLGLLMFRRGQFNSASDFFTPVASESPDSALGRSAKSYLNKISWRLRLDEAVQQFAEGDYEQSGALLDALESERSGDLLVGYYRAYIELRRDRPEAALERFERVLQRHPDDAWSRYMAGVALTRLGRNDEARGRFHALATNAQPDVRRSVKAALARLPLAGGQPRPPRADAVVAAAADRPQGRQSPRLGSLSLSVDVDSNPGYAPESAYSVEHDMAFAVSLAASRTFRLAKSGAFALTVAPYASLRAYPGGPQQYDLLGAGARLELGRRTRSLAGWLGVGGSASLLGWKPFLDMQELYGGARLRVAAWSSSHVGLSLYRRHSHLETYANLSGLGLRASAGQRFSTGRVFWVELGYVVQLEDSASYQFSWGSDAATPETVPYSASLSADSSFIGHGPRAQISVVGPWRGLRVSAILEHQWRQYDGTENIDYDVGDELFRWQGSRSDQRTYASAALSIRATVRIDAFVRVRSLINRSSLSGGVDPVDRSYARTLVLTGVELPL